MNRKIIALLLILIVAMVGMPQALAFGSYLNTFNATYHLLSGQGLIIAVSVTSILQAMEI